MSITLSQDSSLDEYEKVLVGRRVTAAEHGRWKLEGAWTAATGRLTLDDGTTLFVMPNGGCSCGAGDYSLSHLGTVDNIITAVRLVDESTGDHSFDWNSPERYQAGSYSIYVLTDATEINLATVTGDDGNGHYGTGYEIRVVAA